MSILHIVPGLDEVGNGISVAAKLIAAEQKATLVEAKGVPLNIIDGADEVWVHSMWSPRVIRACRLTLQAGKPLVRMLHACVDPVRLNYHGWKKRLVGPIERSLLRRASRIVATCDAEKGWIKSYLGDHCPSIEVTDIKRFYNLRTRITGGGGVLASDQQKKSTPLPLHILFLGRRHPLKGLQYLEQAVAELTSSTPHPLTLKIVSNAFGDELERVWDWCDVLVLPTLSENFGLVIAEALERGKCVITTDGAPAWGDGNTYGGRLVYLNGYRDGTADERISLLKTAIENIAK